MLKEERSLLRPKDERLGIESLRVVVCFNFSNHIYDEATLAKRLRIHRVNRPLNLAQIQFLEMEKLENRLGRVGTQLKGASHTSNFSRMLLVPRKLSPSNERKESSEWKSETSDKRRDGLSKSV